MPRIYMFKLFNVACKWNHHLWKTLIFTGNKKRPWPAEITPQKANLCKIKVFLLYCLIWQPFITLLGHTMHDQLMHCHRILPREASAGSRQNSSENHPMYTQDKAISQDTGFAPKQDIWLCPVTNLSYAFFSAIAACAAARRAIGTRNGEQDT